MQDREAERGRTTEEMEKISEKEDVSIESVMKGVADGRIVIPKNARREEVRPVGIGEGLRTKINANVGTSPDYADVEAQRRALRSSAGVSSGAGKATDGSKSRVARWRGRNAEL